MAPPAPLAPGASLRWHVVHSMLTRLRPQRVLEVGCGQGGFGARIAKMADYVGVEPDDTSWAVANGRIAPLGGEVRHGTSDLVGPDEYFDLVCAFEVIEHLEDDKNALRDWARHVRPGGSIMVSVPAWPQRYGPWDALVGHYRRYTPDQLRAVLRTVGCAQVQVTAYGWPIGYALEAARNRIALRRGTDAESSSADAMATRTASSGRQLQPRQLAGAAVQIGVLPFAQLQKLRPMAGTGLVALGTMQRS